MQKKDLFQPAPIIFCLIIVCGPLRVIAADGLATNHFMESLQKGFSWQLRNLNFALLQNPADSDLNPDNLFEIPRHTLGLDLRPDFKLELSRLKLLYKPRLELRWEHWREGRQKGESESDSDLFVNEWQVQIEPLSNLFLSYGREDLQWGPAFLISPSNPFFTDNGRNHPKIEVAGADYGKLIWILGRRWTFSLIANLDEGRKKLYTDFRKTCAAKVDYLADTAYFSLNLAKPESDDPRLGGFASWNLSDAVLLYGEGSVNNDEVEALVGTSYTFTGGATLHFEYFYNGSGSRQKSLPLYFATLDEAAARESLWRKNYLFFQYYDHGLMDDWSFLLRGTVGLDDESGTLLAYGDYNIGNHVQLFATGTLYQGDRESEFGALLDYSMMVGVELFF